MGLFTARVEFAGEPPANEELLAELARRIGSVRALEPIDRQGRVLEVATLLDPVAYPYLMKLLIERGGVVLDRRGQPLSLQLPAYVDKPWVSYSIFKRCSIRLAFLFGLARA